MKPNFHDVAGLWKCDGSLRDIYLQNADLAHWDRFDRLLARYEHTYTFDGVAAPFPGSHSCLTNREGSHVVSIRLSGPVVVCCQFYIPEQLELDIDPREVTGPREHDAVLSFVEHLAEALDLPADITPEMDEWTPFLTYLPRTGEWRIDDDPRWW